jgi:hypothetical protein
VADLAISVPGDSSASGKGGGGAVNVLYGSSKGLTGKGDQLWNSSRKGLAGLGDQASITGQMTVGNFGHNNNGTAYDDLGFTISSLTKRSEDEGSVEVIFGSTSGLTARHSQNWRWSTPGVKGTGNAYGQFIAAADFGRSQYADLASSQPEGMRFVPGAVSVLYGSRSGLTAKRNQFWTSAKLGHPRITIGYGLGAR